MKIHKHLCKIHFTHINYKSLSVLLLYLLVFIYFHHYWKIFNILPYLSFLDNVRRKVRPVWKFQNHLCKIHFTHINSKSLPVLILCLLVAIYFNKYWKIFNILPYLLLLDNAGRNLRPFWKYQNHLCKIHFTHINAKSLPVLILCLFVAIYFNTYWKIFNILLYLPLLYNI